MANEYVTSAALKATLSITGETYADADIAIALESASRAVDGICGRRFYADADATQVRVYSPSSRDLLRIDDLITLTSLKTDPGGDGTYEQTWTLNTDMVLEPLNPELIDATNRQPWTLIRRHPRGSYYFPADYPRSVQVTGKFGWPAVPAPVQTATSILASILLKRMREAPFGVVALGVDTAARIASTDRQVLALLTPYRRFRV